MKLITHNMLSSKTIKGVVYGYPLIIRASQVLTKDVDFNPEFIQRMIPKLDWSALKFAAKCVGHEEDLPDEPPANMADEDVLKRIHHVVMEVDVVDGFLECPETKRQFPITNGIPNMLLNENDV
ncbi:hypothetical protein HAZT_HAZT006005 [Hyalella azteca]|uniref:Multifunctional methyltransferase subunit TRM112-like protein n=1 Tax=Hyalella azteca TaxID=294128 RepID=A0A6A0GR70_HYAAZ|nr:multifunctional methyltransferase subunit TRM112-like protein [Hyalella azteca]KAA0185359.1 hypothetical protein HAZT_HAZT006005 [Hyalella azteca]